MSVDDEVAAQFSQDSRDPGRQESLQNPLHRGSQAPTQAHGQQDDEAGKHRHQNGQQAGAAHLGDEYTGAQSQAAGGEETDEAIHEGRRRRPARLAGEAAHIVDAHGIATDVAEQNVVEEHPHPVEDDGLSQGHRQGLTPEQQEPLAGAEGIADDEESGGQDEEPDLGALQDGAESGQVGLRQQPVEQTAADKQFGCQVAEGAQRRASLVAVLCPARHQVPSMTSPAVRRRRT